jgi:prepilin-type N-terminal cleavage/methylation domain-containing protein
MRRPNQHAAALVSKSAGFTLIEVLVSLAIMIIAFTGVLALIDASARVNKSEIDLSDTQQAVRGAFNSVLTLARESGSGGFAYSAAVIPVADNVTAAQSTNLIRDDTGAFVPVRPGTDVFAVRGVLTTTVSGMNTGAIPIPGGPPISYDPSTNLIQIPLLSAAGGALGTAASGNFSSSTSDPIIAALTSPTISATNKRFYILDDVTTASYSVFALHSPADCYFQSVKQANCSGSVDAVVFTGFPGPTDTAAARFDLSPASPPTLASATLGGVAEELVFFVRDDTTNPTNPHPTLMQGEMVDADATGPKYRLSPVAEDVEDLQVAYFIAPSADQPYNPIEDRSAAGADGWVPNAAAETLPNPSTFQDAFGASLLKGLRIAVVAKSANPDPTARGNRYALGTVDATGPSVENSGLAINTAVSTTIPYRRRLINIAFDLRNYN